MAVGGTKGEPTWERRRRAEAEDGGGKLGKQFPERIIKVGGDKRTKKKC